MSDGKRKRLSMLDGLAAAAAPPAPDASMMSQHRALRAARDAVDTHRVWDLDPALIDDGRVADRLDPTDIHDLREAIEANGQTVPILVRRNPADPDRYLLVYGRRRLEAIRASEKVGRVRALVAAMGEAEATRAQISENMARRDLSFIEKALFARNLVDSGYGNQTEVAEVLTVPKSAISMALAIVDAVGPDLAVAIGAAHGVGRPRWEALGKAIAEGGADRARLIAVANGAQDAALVEEVSGSEVDPSVAAFEAVAAALPRPDAPSKAPASKAASAASRGIVVEGRRAAKVGRTARSLRIDITEGSFADWLDANAEAILNELHASWKRAEEDR